MTLSIIVPVRNEALVLPALLARASGDVLLFLHADTELPHGVIDCIAQALTSGVRHWGRFDVCISGQHWAMCCWG